MSDGGFDVDRLLKQRNESENLFGITTDPITKQRVCFPFIPKSVTPDKTQRDSAPKNESAKKTCTLSANSSSTFEIKKRENDNRCHKCESVHRCKLVEQGFFELCPHKL